MPEAPFKISMRWQTSVVRKRDGSETRAAIATKPFEAYAFSILLDEEGARELRADMVLNAEDRRLIPLPHHELIAEAPVTGASITVGSTLFADLLGVGQRVLIVNRSRRYAYQAVVQSTTVTDITVDATPPPGQVYPAQVTSIVPLMACLLVQPVGTGRYPVHASKVDVIARRCEVDPLIGTGGGGVPTFLGIPIFGEAPMEPLPSGSDRLSQEQTDAQIDLVDHGMGPEFFFDAAFGPVQRAHDFLILDDATRQQWKVILKALRGRQKMFLFATHRSDFAILSQTSDTLTVTGTRYMNYYKATGIGSAIFSRMRVTYVDGTTGSFTIVDQVDNGDGTETLTLDTFDTTVTSASLLEQVRLASDEVTWDFRTGGSKLSLVMVNCVA